MYEFCALHETRLINYFDKKYSSQLHIFSNKSKLHLISVEYDPNHYDRDLSEHNYSRNYLQIDQIYIGTRRISILMLHVVRQYRRLGI